MAASDSTPRPTVVPSKRPVTRSVPTQVKSPAVLPVAKSLTATSLAVATLPSTPLPVAMPVKQATDSPKRLQTHLLQLQTSAAVPKFHAGSIDSQWEDSDSFGDVVLSGARSWLVSMIVHVLVILFLAWLSLQGNPNRVFSLVMEFEQSDGLKAMAELDFRNSDLNELEVSGVENPMEENELLEFQPEMEIADDTVDSPLDFGSAFANEEGLDQRLSSAELDGEAGGSSFFGIAATGDDVVFIVDRSGSMDGQRWRDATSELMTAIRTLQPDQRFYVFLFSASCHPMPQMAGRNKMVKATPENIATFEKWLVRQQPDDTTMPRSSVQRALRMNPDTIFLLTDGNFADDTHSFLMKYSDKRFRTDSASVVINTIAFHCDVGLEKLREIALQNEGVFRSVE